MTKKKSDCNTNQQDVLFLIPTLHLISSNLLFHLSFFVGFGLTLSRNNSSKLLFAGDVAAVELMLHQQEKAPIWLPLKTFWCNT